MSVRSTGRGAARPAPPARASARSAAGSRQAKGVASAPDRFDQRRRSAGRARSRVMVRIVLALALVGGLTWLVGYSRVLAVRTVDVSGVSEAQASAIARLADSQLGVPLARVDLAAVTAAVRARPEVESVAVGRSWPTTLAIEVTPRTAAAAWKNPKGQLEVVDGNGVAFEVVSSPPPGVPLITFTGSGTITGDAVRAALTARESLPSDLAALLTGVSVSSADLVTFTMGGTTVAWGSPDQAEKKTEILRLLLKSKPAFVDVSAPTTPVTRSR